jgi:hypothetical protein
MLKRYFEVFDEVARPGRWELDDPRTEDGEALSVRALVRGEPVTLRGMLEIPLCRPGTPLDFSFLVGGPVPVVGQKLADLLEELAPNETQLFPARVESRGERYYVVNVPKTIRCIDDRSSREVKLWRPEDGQPERIGQYRNVRGMRIDPAAPGDAKIFRPWGWTVALVVSEELKDAMGRVGATGAKFEEV